jgi:hypothetical protein
MALQVGSAVVPAFSFGFSESAHMATEGLDSTVQVAIFFKILFKGGGAHMLKNARYWL